MSRNVKWLDGLTIDFHSSRLYCAEFEQRKIQSSNLDGGDVFTVANGSGKPFALALVWQRMYWSLSNTKFLQSSNNTHTRWYGHPDFG